ncbi:helix-turn-helix domain-containing protein [Paenibacillus tundrae]
MKSAIELFKSEFFLNNNLKLYVNRCSENFDAPFHAHDFVEYCYVAEGKGFHHIGEDVIPVHKGMLFVIPIGIPHVFRPSSPNLSVTPLIIYNCLFNAELTPTLNMIIQEQTIRDHLKHLELNEMPYVHVIDRNQQIEDMMIRLYKESSLLDAGSSTMLYTLVSQLVVTTYRQYQQDYKQTHSNTDDFEHVLRYLNHHIHERIRLRDLVHISSWSEKHLGRLFLKHTGQTFGSYLQHLRIQKSCELLKSSQHNVSLIAELVGYRDVDTFHAVFKKITGTTPHMYRKSYTSD